MPSNVCVDVTAHAGAGRIDVAGTTADGLDVSSDQGTGSTATPRLLLDASVDAGELRVVNSDDASLGEGGLGWAGTDNAALRAAESRACGGGRG